MSLTYATKIAAKGLQGYAQQNKTTGTLQTLVHQRSF